MWSHRWPALRGLGVLVITLLLPFEWVVEVDACTELRAVKTYTGTQLMGQVGADITPWMVLALALMVAAPLLATRLRPPWALVTQVLGAAATGLVAYLAWIVIFFALFAERTLRPAGGAVVAVVLLGVVDGVARPVLAAREWWRGRSPPR